MSDPEPTALSTSSESGGALEGVRILEAGLLIQGPQSTQLLSDLGADVVKVELPGFGDQARAIPARAGIDRRPPIFIACNRGKRSLALDLRTPDGQAVFRKLAETADVVVSNFMPGTMDGWGIGYEALATINPGIIFASGSAYGSQSSDGRRRGADLGGQASGGILTRIGDGTRPVVPIGVLIADHIGSQNMANAIMAALLARHRTGRGQAVEVSLYGGQIFAQATELTTTSLTGMLPEPPGQGHALLPLLYGIFPTSDGHIALVGAPDPEELYRVLDRPEMIEDPRFNARGFAPEVLAEIHEIFNVAFATRSRAEWIERFQGTQIRYAPVQNYLEVLNDQGAHDNGYLQRVDHPEYGDVVLPGSPIRLTDTPATPGIVAPELGQHSREVLREVGYDKAELDRLADLGVI